MGNAHKITKKVKKKSPFRHCKQNLEAVPPEKVYWNFQDIFLEQFVIKIIYFILFFLNTRI